MNDEPFDPEFIDGVKSITRSEVHFHVIPKEHWSYPEWINQTYAAEERQKMVDENVICEFFLFFELYYPFSSSPRRQQMEGASHIEICADSIAVSSSNKRSLINTIGIGG
jgi:hypothetical protein